MCLSFEHLNFSKTFHSLGYIQCTRFAIIPVGRKKKGYKMLSHMVPPCTTFNTKHKVNISKVFLASLPNVDASL